MQKKFVNITLFIVTAIIITLMMPSGGVFKYKFNFGQVWNSAPIVAPFDFPLLKTSQEYQEDIRNYEKSYIPIYKIDTSISEKTLSIVSGYFSLSDSSDHSIKKRAGQILYTSLKEIYNRGIINNQDSNLSYNNLIRVVKGNEIKTMSISNVYTIESAKKQITESLITSKIPYQDYSLYPIADFISSNMVYDIALNESVKSTEIGKISKTKGFVSKGSIILNDNETIDNTSLNRLNSFQKEFNRKGGVSKSYLSVFGTFVFILILMVLSFFSLKNFRADVMEKTKNVLFLVILYLLTAAITMFITQETNINIYAIPFVIVPFYIAAFYSSKMSVHQYIYVLLIVSLMAPAPFEFVVINFLSGIVGILIIKHSYKRRTIMLAVATTLLTYIVLYCVVNMISSGNFDGIEPRMFMWFVINAGSLYVLYQLLFLIEKIFNFVTRITLFELCDTNGTMLSEMAKKAPGSFQHSLQVANLAQEAAKSIGANDLLARTGALYHDIGKTINPMFFIENNSSLEAKPHEELPPRESAKIIKGHVIDGVNLAKKHKLPEVVIEFITSHHGDSLIYFFYRKELDACQGAVDMEDFKYPGPKPQTKEAVICMMADAIEAASRSLADYSEESITKLIDEIITNQMSDGQYSDSVLRFRDIDKIKASFKKTLMNIYHGRVAYPKRP